MPPALHPSCWEMLATIRATRVPSGLRRCRRQLSGAMAEGQVPGQLLKFPSRAPIGPRPKKGPRRAFKGENTMACYPSPLEPKRPRRFPVSRLLRAHWVPAASKVPRRTVPYGEYTSNHSMQGRGPVAARDKDGNLDQGSHTKVTRHWNIKKPKGQWPHNYLEPTPARGVRTLTMEYTSRYTVQGPGWCQPYRARSLAIVLVLFSCGCLVYTATTLTDVDAPRACKRSRFVHFN